MDDNISTIVSVLGLGGLVVTAEDVRCPDLILSPSWTWAKMDRRNYYFHRPVYGLNVSKISLRICNHQHPIII